MIRLMMFCLAAAAVPLSAQNPAVAANIDEAFRLAGVRNMLQSLPSHVNEMTAAAVAQLPRDQRRQFEPVIKDVSVKFLNPDAFEKQLRTYFARHYDEARMGTFLALERTPVYRTMHRQEEASETPAAHAAMRRFELSMKSDPPSATRVSLLQRLDQARNTTELQVKMVMGIVNAMATGLGAQMPPDLEAQSAAFKEKLRPILAGTVLIQNLYMYRNASDVDIDDYIGAAQQKDVAWFNRTLQAAVLAVAADRAARAGESIKARVASPVN
jgi:hypothetical protein